MLATCYAFFCQGGGDDTAANCLELICDGATVTANCLTSWGDWTYEECPPGQIICGMRAQVESDQGDGDNTSLNGLELYCCYNF